MTGRTDRTWAALVLGSCALLSLVLGGWVSFRDRGVDEWSGNVATLFVALTLAVAAIALAVGHPRTRLVLGGAFVVLVCGLIVAGSLADFRFVWRGDETGLFVLEVVCAAVGMTLLAPAYLVPGGSATGAQNSGDEPMSPQAITGRELSGVARTCLWLATAVVAGVVGYNLGTYAYGAPDCDGVQSDVCTRAGVAGLVGLILALLIVAVTCVVVVSYKWHRRRSRGRAGATSRRVA